MSPRRRSRLSRPKRVRNDYQREFMARRREEARQKGICTRCTVRPAAAPLHSCDVCLRSRRASA